MKTLKNINIIAIIFALGLFGTILIPHVVQAASESSTAYAKESPKGRVSFKSDLSIADVLKLTSEKGLRVEMVEGEFTVGNTSSYDFYWVKPGQDAKGIEDDYKKSRLAYLKSLLESQDEQSAEKRQLPATQVADMTSTLKKGDIGKVMIKKITVSGDEATIQSLTQNQSVEQAKVIKAELPPLKSPMQQLQGTIKKGTYRTDSSQTKPNTITSMMTQTLPSIPNQGMVDTKTSSQYSGQREAINWMYWGNMSFGSTQAYEQELFFDNYDGQSFLNSATTASPGCFPVAQYASTNFPTSSRPYIDTRLKQDGTCETNELEFTIGAFQANQLQVNTTYWTYFRTTNGNASTDRMWLGGQIGHQSPSGGFCPSGYETWCVFGDDPNAGDLHADLIQAWKSGVPWQHYWAWDVRFCEHDRNGGFGQCYDLGPGTYDLTEFPNFNDALTTIRIGGGLKWNVTVYDNVNPSTNYCYGNSWQFISNGSRWEINLYEGNLNFNDKTSCIVVELQ